MTIGSIDANDTYFVLPAKLAAPVPRAPMAGSEPDVFALLRALGGTPLVFQVPGPYAVRCCAVDTAAAAPTPANSTALPRYNAAAGRLKSVKPAAGSGALWAGRRSHRRQFMVVECIRASLTWCTCPRLSGQEYLAGAAVLQAIDDLRPATKDEADMVLARLTPKSLPDYIRVKSYNRRKK
ncbi:hypothetical protein GCM10023185_01920 [Hymenobacter saemangeumensis]|uniref:Uncharacterized protein n=1 Tax=Hymenobacter saemangeumensis TaxID=1084522 RepID=A0ABP8HXQ8_9BACT